MGERSQAQYGFGHFQLDTAERVLSRNGIALELPPKAFDLLDLLVRNAGHLLPKRQIMEAVWPDTFVEEANLANLIALLRKTLGDSREMPAYIQTVPKRGYRFIAMAPENAPCRPSVEGQGHAESTVRIIVFPFRTDAAGADAGYPGYSLAEAICATLAELNAFTVRSTQSAMQFDPVQWDPKSVAEKADVEVILTGSIVQTGERLHATTELIDAPSGAVIWSKVWDIDTCELLRLHKVVVQVVTRLLVLRTGEEGAPIPAGVETASSEAYQLYLRGCQLMLKRSPENMMLARDVYVACTAMDPTFAMAWARLGRCCRWLEKFGAPGAVADNAAERAFQQAFRLNPDLVVAHTGYTPIQCDGGHAPEAMVRLLRLLRRNESNPEIFSALVHASRYCGLLNASLAAHERAFRLDPKVATSVAHTYFALGDYDKTLYWYDRKAGLYLDAAALASMGRMEEASALLWTRRDRFAVQPGLMRSLQCYLDGDRAGGLDALRSVLPQPRDPEVCFYMARQSSRFGDTGLATQLLREAVECGYWSSVALTRDPWFEALRSTADFEELLSEVLAREAAARRAFDEAGGLW